MNFSPYFQIVFEDNHLIIVNKRSGVPSQGDKTGDQPLVEYVRDYIREAYKKPGNVFAGLIHRLDRPVSGLVILAKTSKALERMNRQFQEKQVRKIYWAIVKSSPPKQADTLVNWLVKNQKTNFTKAFDKEVKGSLRAELSYKVIAGINDYYALEINPATGRPHQIRVQLSAMGCPIRGDVKYGFQGKNQDASINLHARRLIFTHPVTKKTIDVVAPLPSTKEWEMFRRLELMDIT